MAVELAKYHFLLRCVDGAKVRPGGTCVFYLYGYNNSIQVFKRRLLLAMTHMIFIGSFYDCDRHHITL